MTALFCYRLISTLPDPYFSVVKTVPGLFGMHQGLVKVKKEQHLVRCLPNA